MKIMRLFLDPHNLMYLDMTPDEFKENARIQVNIRESDETFTALRIWIEKKNILLLADEKEFVEVEE